MKNIYQALTQFKEDDYYKNQTLYQSLSEKQTPHTLFISCSDSRITPERLLQAEPGEIFHLRNIANIVPSFNQNTDNCSTTSAIEFAVEVLEVENIIICGHSNCGGCAACMGSLSDIQESLPYTAHWLSQLEDLIEIYQNNQISSAYEFESLNVVQQLNNLLSYPQIKQKVAEKKLNLHGWHYNIGQGEISVYNQELQEFEVY